MEKITYEMLPEFEFNADTSKKFNAWAYLDSIDSGTSEEDALLIYGLTKDDAKPYKEEYNKLKSNESRT